MSASHSDDLSKILDSLAAEPRTPKGCGPRHGCKHCKCFLAVVQEDQTGFHIRNKTGGVDFVVVYPGKFYCRACHRYQSE